MEADLFLQQFGHLAQGEGGIKKLRDVILQLAVRGKLVEQNFADEPADVLLKKIEAEKKRLVKQGSIKDFKTSSIDSKNLLFDIPRGWAWCTLGTLGLITSSCRVHEKDWTTRGVPFLRAREIVKLAKAGHLDNELFISEDHYQRLTNEGLTPEPNDIMITGVGTIGVPYIVRDSDRFYFKDASVLIFKNYFGLYPHYLNTVMQSPYWIEEIHRDSMGTTVYTLTIVRAKQTPVPLPPLAEQKRIVAKVDELMVLCDKLETEQNAERTLKTQTVQSTLHHLTNAESRTSFGTSLNIMEKKFNDWFDDLATVKHLRATILQLAVQGKLVPQNPADEPASELLKRIEAEKKRLVKEGKIKSARILQPVEDDKQIFEISGAWCWIRLGDLCPEFQNGVSSRGEKEGAPTIVLRLADIKDGVVSLADTRQIILAHELKEKYALKHQDILIIRVNGSEDLIGKFILCESDLDAIYCDHFIRMRINSTLYDASFMKLVASSPYIRSIIKGLFITTAGQKTVNHGHISSLPLPLPPLAEQRRIVAKVDELMTLCDQLEAHITQAQTLNTHLMDSLIHRISEAA